MEYEKALGLPSGEAPCGFINLLKPPGMSSAQAVGHVRWLMNGVKAGHGGTLDPEAAGVLPLMIGKAARLFDYMQDKEKTYVTEVAFGAATDTQDAQGVVLRRGENYPDEAAIRAALERFTGVLMQRPPMYSALKQNGKCLYELARQGKTTDVPEREVTVYDLDLCQMTANHGALLRVRCSKGFYVRTLCNDLGESLGCPAHMRFLLRTESGAFTLRSAVTLERLQAAKEENALADLLLPPETALGHLPWADVPPEMEKAFRNGVPLPWSRFPVLRGTMAESGKPVCLRLNGRLCAVAERQGDSVRTRTWLGE